MAHVSSGNTGKATARVIEKMSNGWMFEITVGSTSIYLTAEDLKAIVEVAKPLITLTVAEDK